MKAKLLLITAAAAVTSLIPCSLLAAQTYDITELAPLSDDDPGATAAAAINNVGQIVGQSSTVVDGHPGPGHAVLWRRTGPIIEKCDLGSGNTDLESYAYATNNRGDVVGRALFDGMPGAHAFFCHTNGPPCDDCHMVDLGVVDDGTYSVALGINDTRPVQIVGQAYGSDRPDSSGRAVVWQPGAPAMVLPGRPPLVTEFANDINDAGLVVGTSGSGPGAVLWHLTGGSARRFSLGALPGGLESEANAINNRGLVAGASSDSPINIKYAVLFGVSTIGQSTIASLDQETPARALAVNANGIVVGEFQAAGDKHAALFTPTLDGWLLEDLNDLIPPASGWILSRATGINDAGSIVGEGLYNSTSRAFLLTPTGGP